MKQRSESWVFGLTAASAATVLVSVSLSQSLLAGACLTWIIFRPKRLRLPRHYMPLGAFFATTLLSLAISVDPTAGAPTIRKFVLFSMGILAANFVTTAKRLKLSFGLLILVAAISSVLGLVQFGVAYGQYLATGDLADDPTVLARATGFMGHWMTYGGQQLLVWCAALPALVLLGQRWLWPLSAIGLGIVSGFTRSVWLGAIAGMSIASLGLSRLLLAGLLIPLALATVVASPLIYHRLSLSTEADFGPDVGRLALIQGAAGMIREHPMFGVGPERVGTEFPSYYTGDNLDTFYYGHMHNNILQIAAERGLLCLLMFVWFFVDLCVGLVGLRRAGSATVRVAALSGLAALTGFLVAGLFEYNFGDSEVLMLFLFLVSVPFGLEAGGNEDGELSAGSGPART